eukprot:2283341-Ditylum_brightwellii.AAC.1
MKIICLKLLKNGGEGIGIKQTHCIFQEYADNKIIANGKVSSYEGGKPVNNTTARTYHEELALHQHIRIKRSVVTKALPRIAKENSLHSVTIFFAHCCCNSFHTG